MITVVAVAAFVAAGTYIGQVHHDNGCSQYANALRGAVSDPKDGLSSTANLLPKSVRTVAKNSEAKYRQTLGLVGGATIQDWDQFEAAFVAEGLAASGC